MLRPIRKKDWRNIMHFTELTDERITPLIVQNPSLAGIRLWNCAFGGYAWVIMYEPGEPDWPEKDKAKYVGYSVTFRPQRTDTTEFTRVGGGPWATFDEAFEAATAQWKRMQH